MPRHSKASKLSKGVSDLYNHGEAVAAAHLGLLRSEHCRVNTEQFTRAAARPASLWHQPETDLLPEIALSFPLLPLPTQSESGECFNTRNDGELFFTSAKKCLTVGSWISNSSDSRTRAAFTAAESFRIHTAGCDLRRRTRGDVGRRGVYCP